MTDRTFIELIQRGVTGGAQVCASKHFDLFCSHCARPRNPNAPTEMNFEDDRLVHSPLSGDPFHGITLAKKSLLDLIEIKDISRYLNIGSVRSISGKLFADWLYLYNPARIIIRGTREAKYRLCPDCGHTLYSSQGPQYLYPAPPKDIPIFQSDRSSLIVDSQYLDRIKLPKTRWLGSQILKISDKPRDGLGELPYPFG